MKSKDRRLEDIRRSCLKCGYLHYNHQPCCADPYCVSDLMRDLENSKKEKQPPQENKFYVGIRELFEKPKRQGYATDIKEAGVFTHSEALAATKFCDAEGYYRWMIPYDTLINFNDGMLKPTSVY